jgi:hypothetical protein
MRIVPIFDHSPAKSLRTNVKRIRRRTRISLVRPPAEKLYLSVCRLGPRRQTADETLPGNASSLSTLTRLEPSPASTQTGDVTAAAPRWGRPDGKLEKAIWRHRQIVMPKTCGDLLDYSPNGVKTQ